MLLSSNLTERISSLDREIYTQVLGFYQKKCKAVARYLDEHKEHPFINCHVISRLIAQNVREVSVSDGFMLGISSVDNELKESQYTHSWLKCPNGSIVDVYPVGFFVTEPILVPKMQDDQTVFWGLVYIEEEATSKCISTPELDAHVAQWQEILDIYGD